MPKDVSKAGHRGIGFVTFQSSDALERVMATTHTLHGTELAVDRAEPKASVGPTQSTCAAPAHVSVHQPVICTSISCYPGCCQPHCMPAEALPPA